MSDILSIKKNHIFTGRAATGIYLLTKSLKLERVVAPSNLCYAALFPITFAGGTVLLSDTDEKDGNISYELFLKCIEKNQNADAVIVPHMYGNPCRDIFRIKKYCSENELILIEDCASSMGASLTDEEGNVCPTGSVGDYVLYSTGYAKTLDLGRGGILASDLSLDEMEEMTHDLPVYSERIDRDETFFSRLYRLLRNDPEVTYGDDLYKVLREKTGSMFLYRADEKYEEELMSGLESLSQEIKIRWDKLNLYNSLIEYGKQIVPYDYYEGAVPWRFNVFVEESHRKELIRKLLEKSVPVSDWYPDVSVMFGIREKHIGTETFEKRILNFPLTLDDDRIQELARILNSEVKTVYGNSNH